MAIPYEKAVLEDLNIGYGTLAVTMPAGGSATGTKIGLHSFAGFLNVKEYGAIGDGAVNDAAAIQAAINAANGLTNPLGVFFPPGTWHLGSTSITLPTGITLAGVDYSSSVITYNGSGSAFTFTKAVNGSGYGRVTIRDLKINCTASAGSNTGAALELNAGGYAYFRIYRCQLTGAFKYGIIGDAIEVSVISDNIIENGAGVSNSVNIWLVNGDERRSGQSIGFTNGVVITNNQIANGNIGICDDGGDSRVIAGNNMNGVGMAIHLAGCEDAVIMGNNWENQGTQTMPANVRFSDRSGVGGATATVDKGTCQGVTLQGNDFNCGVVTASNSSLMFTATTAGAYHKAIRVHGNLFKDVFGRSATIDVSRLAYSFCGNNSDESSTGFHYNNVHNDQYGNTLLLPDTVNNNRTLAKTAYAYMPQVLTASATWDPGNLAADGDVTSTTIAVTGSVEGDPVIASHDALGANNALLVGHVSVAGTVRVVLMNKTGGAYNVASGTLRVLVFKTVT